jgi:hypothetical protein
MRSPTTAGDKRKILQEEHGLEPRTFPTLPSIAKELLLTAERATCRGPLIVAALMFAILGIAPVASQGQAGGNLPAATSMSAADEKSWTFAVSGDSRNCGDVVMPAIAAGAERSGAAFYWHLGDFRKIYGVDEDIAHEPERRGGPLTLPEYEALAWDDFISSQLNAFGGMPVYLDRGNHETARGRTDAQYLSKFGHWLDQPNLRAQRLLDDPNDSKPHIYYHWIQRGIDFITLDNAIDSHFDAEQMAWFEKTLRADSAMGGVHTIVVGMHEALPESISKSHSMNESESGTQSGEIVYADLLKARKEAHKNVYVLASHSHYYMDGIFNTKYWRGHGGVLPGWIVGTAGAVRYTLPSHAASARAARTNVYGFLTGTVNPDGQIEFKFHELKESDVPGDVVQRYTPDFVHWCFTENSEAKRTSFNLY